MKRTHNLHSFFAGVLVTALFFALAVPAGAALAGKAIQVFTGVDLYVDDVKLEPKDAKGNPVEVFVYNGTTYLPVRAVGDAVGKTVQWDAKSNSVYLGKHTGEKPAVWLKDLDYFTGNTWETYTTMKDNLGNEHTNVITGQHGNTYRLNGQYSMISGVFFQNYEKRSSTFTSTLEVYGDGELLYTAEMLGGLDPINFTVDLTGVLELRVYLETGNWSVGNCAAIGECGLWT